MYNKLTIMLLRTFMFVLTTFLFCNIAFAQGKMKGNITDSRAEAIIGANVLIEGTNIGAATDFDGNYTIENIPLFT